MKLPIHSINCFLTAFPLIFYVLIEKTSHEDSNISCRHSTAAESNWNNLLDKTDYLKCRICNLTWIGTIRDGGFIFCMNHDTIESLREPLVFTMKCRQIISSVICRIIPKELPFILHCKCEIYFILQAWQILWYETFASYCTLWVKTNILTI